MIRVPNSHTHKTIEFWYSNCSVLGGAIHLLLQSRISTCFYGKFTYILFFSFCHPNINKHHFVLKQNMTLKNSVLNLFIFTLNVTKIVNKTFEYTEFVAN